MAFDRARLAQIDAIRGGAEPPAPAPDDVAARVRAALPLAMSRDPDVFRAGLEISSCLALPQEVFARPGLAQRVLEAAGGEAAKLPGPDRAQVLESSPERRRRAYGTTIGLTLAGSSRPTFSAASASSSP